jgi:hypothetical protein
MVFPQIRATQRHSSRYDGHHTLLVFLSFCALAGGCDPAREESPAGNATHDAEGDAFAAILRWGGDARCYRSGCRPPTNQRQPMAFSPGTYDVVIAIYNSRRSPTSPTLDITDERLRIVAQLKELRFLQLRSTKVTDAGTKHLRGLTLLEGLDLSNTKITDNGLADLTRLENLRSLQLQHTAITDSGLKYLTGLHRLEDLFLQHTSVTDAGIARLKKSLPVVRVVYSHKRAVSNGSALSNPVQDSETTRYVLMGHERATLMLHALAIDADPGLNAVARWIAKNRDALEIVSYSSGHIMMPVGDELIWVKKDGRHVRYTLRGNISTPYPRSYDDTIDGILSNNEREAIEGVFEKYGRPLDKQQMQEIRVDSRRGR